MMDIVFLVFFSVALAYKSHVGVLITILMTSKTHKKREIIRRCILKLNYFQAVKMGKIQTFPDIPNIFFVNLVTFAFKM